MKYLIKIAPEITIKSDGVRRQCIKRLKTNIEKHLDFDLIDSKIKGNWDRIMLEVADIEDQEKVIAILKRVAGIGKFYPVIEYDLITEFSPKNELIFSDIAGKTKDYFTPRVEGKSFVVRVRRAGNHTFRSIDIERHLGGVLLGACETARVDLHNPDITVQLDIKDEKYYIIEDEIKGIEGYPIGFQEKILSLISGGFDSGVSSYSLMKRGCQVDYLFFNLGGSAHELGVKQVSQYLWQSFSLPHKKARFISVPFEGVMHELITNVNHKYRGIILKRLMLQVASRIADQYYYALVKGDSIGQVSSQTLKNMYVVDKASSALVFRPLIAMNKQEIIDIAMKIGTYDFACSMPEYCGVISDRPSIGADLEDILEEEKNLSENLLETAFMGRKTELVSKMLLDSQITEIQEVKTQAEGEIIIDIREKMRVEKSPLSQKGYSQVEAIAFVEINHRFAKLDQEKEYLFYCDKGVLSHLHGLYLREKGFNNIKVFRP